MSKKKDLPRATHEGTLKIGDYEMTAYNLPNGERLLSRTEFIRALGRTGKAKGGRQFDEEFGLPVFLTAGNLKPYITSELEENSTPRHFLNTKGQEVIGYKAELLPSVCYVFVDAAEQGEINRMQVHIVDRAKALIRGFATVGIIALIDEATGYQEERGRKALQEFLDKVLVNEARKWTKTFPNDFFEAIFKMKGWTWNEAAQGRKPSVVGHYINNYVYSRLGPDLLTELRKRNPKLDDGKRAKKMHQFTSEDFGAPELQQRLRTLADFARAAGYNWTAWTRMVERAYPQFKDQYSLQFTVEDAQVVEE
jgi:hypothetical protein